MKKGISEYTFAFVVMIVLFMVYVAILSKWLNGELEKQQESEELIKPFVGCSDNPDVCKTNSDGFSCVRTITYEYVCGCRAWLGIQNNLDCPSNRICDSMRGVNYGECV